MTVVGAKISKTVKFVPVVYKVTFSESGLPAGTRWWVNLTNGQSFNSSKTSVSFNESNGSYDYSLGSANEAYKSASGNFAVDGAKVTEKVKFSRT